MKTYNQNTAPLAKIAKSIIPFAVATQAVKVDTQANVQEVAALIQQAMSTTEATSQVHAQTKTLLEEKAKNAQGSKLDFLQKVVTLDCFFGGSDCLFKDKKSMMAGEVTEFAKKKIEQQNTKNAANILAQVKSDVAAVTKANAKKIDDKKKEASLSKQLHDSVQGLINLSSSKTEKKAEAPKTSPAAPASKTMSQVNLAGVTAASRSTEVKVPIDEVKAIGVKLEPTYALDDLQSVSLKAFRKVIGYDTFNSILKKDRDEVKDPADYYNVTVSMLIKRNAVAGPQKVLNDFNGGKKISPTLDKGFPYDDGDNSISDHVRKQKKPAAAEFVGKLNGENMTKAQIKNLVVDKTQPLTESNFVLLKGDGDNVFKLMDSNVTKGQMKNLITDKPAPITVKLAQTKGDGDNVFKLMDSNVTKGQMKNLITDKPAPITVKLAQMKNPVVNPPFNNWSVNQPSVPHEHGLAGTEDVGLRNIVIEGVNGYDLVQTGAKNPVVNPPFNNWSVNQPSVPHDHGLAGDADLGQNIIVDGHAIKFAQKEKKVRLAQIVPVDTLNNEPGNFNIVEKDYEHDPAQLIQLKEVDNAPGVFAIVDTDDHQSIE